MEVTGAVKHIGQIVERGDSGQYLSREFVISTEEQYPQTLAFELSGNNVHLPETLRLHHATDVTVHFNLKGREWVNPQGETKYFNSLQAWKLDVKTAAQQQAPQQGYGNY